MSKKNRERRAANTRRKAQANGPPPPRPSARPSGGADPTTEQLLAAAAYAWPTEPARVQALLDVIAQRDDAADAVEASLLSQAEAAWSRGWTPSDLLRFAGRRLTDVHV